MIDDRLTGRSIIIESAEKISSGTQSRKASKPSDRFDLSSEHIINI